MSPNQITINGELYEQDKNYPITTACSAGIFVYFQPVKDQPMKQKEMTRLEAWQYLGEVPGNIVIANYKGNAYELKLWPDGSLSDRPFRTTKWRQCFEWNSFGDFLKESPPASDPFEEIDKLIAERNKILIGGEEWVTFQKEFARAVIRCRGKNEVAR